MNTHFAQRRRGISAIWIIIILTGMLLACGGEGTPTPAELCGQSVMPTDNDVQYLIGFTGDTFNPDEWTSSHATQELRASATWLNDPEGGLVYAEYLLYNCGYTQEDMNRYFSEANFKNVIFKAYQDVQVQQTCTAGDGALSLYEFRAIWGAEPYTLFYWIKQDTPTRVLTMLLALPESSVALREHYSQSLFPTLPACPE